MIKPAREVLQSPKGCLISPTREFCMFFIGDPRSATDFPNVITQLWYCLEDGTRTKLKNTRILDFQAAHETWNELLSQDWELVEPQINNQAA